MRLLMAHAYHLGSTLLHHGKCSPTSTLPPYYVEEQILEALPNVEPPWHENHSHPHVSPNDATTSPEHSLQYFVESKDFIPSSQVDWFTNPIPALDAFEEGHTANISPTIKVDIYVVPIHVDLILLGASCSAEEIV